MAYQIPVLDITLEAHADLSAKQFHFVKIHSANKVSLCTAITDAPIGVLQNKPEAGQAAAVRVWGVSKLSADAAITAGAILGTSTDSQAQTAVATNVVCARALEAAGAASVIIAALVMPATSIKA
mgnify:CR=1 FL=1|tara:strand:- start:967 stop:1341 length:375 start_codon:yes stop_codon:yes gene_type:complete